MVDMDSMPVAKVAFLWKLAARVVPETAELEDAGCGRFESIIDRALAEHRLIVMIRVLARIFAET